MSEVVALVDDLFFQARLLETAKQVGVELRMCTTPDALAAEGLHAKMLLQVHDELVFEVPEAEAERTCKVVSTVMEKAAEPALDLSVPLVVEARAAADWDAAH